MISSTFSWIARSRKDSKSLQATKDFFEFHLDGELRQSVRERFVGALQRMEAFYQRFVDEYSSKLEADRAFS
ncbi:MAG: hypothetical protein AAGB46_16755 [Verrucomicrobiota bacterium]